ncbi:HEAT repeat domain-containing protein [Candidatus Lokiarchaeum ossiferum]|uniref:HEAT repeat domain-containing protein n=1 Tax=Candidatus Lokiarchaeum ossiferum TaxID=2951803 RepID=UPI00352D7F84
MSTDIQDLIQKLGDRNTKARLDAANALARKGNEALDEVTKLLNHDDYTFRRIAAYVLGKIGNPDSVEILVEALGDDNSDVRKSAAQALNRIGKPAIPLLIRALGNISKDVRASAVWSLSKMGSMVVDPLIEALASEVKDVRASAVWALSKVGTPSIAPLVQLIDNDEKNVRESAIWGLAKIGTPAIEKLAEHWNVRIGEDAREGESETDSVDISDLIAGGENAIKQWIKFMIDNRHKPEGLESTPESEVPKEE